MADAVNHFTISWDDHKYLWWIRNPGRLYSAELRNKKNEAVSLGIQMAEKNSPYRLIVLNKDGKPAFTASDVLIKKMREKERDIISALDLEFDYIWEKSSSESASLFIRDNYKMNRAEGFEVLHFINAFARENGIRNKGVCNKIENLIQSARAKNLYRSADLAGWLKRAV